MVMHVLATEFELHLPTCQSLKDKRSVLRPVIEGIRRRHDAAVAEVDHQDLWQRAAVGVAVVAAQPSHAEELADAVDRFVWSFPELEVTSTARHWLERD